MFCIYILFCWKRCRCIENEQLMIQFIQREYKIYARIKNCDWVRSQCNPSVIVPSPVIVEPISLAVVRNINKKIEISQHIASTECDYQNILDQHICVCAEGSFKDFYLCVCAALSNVWQTYDDSLNTVLIRTHSLLKLLLFIAETCKFSSQILSL